MKHIQTLNTRDMAKSLRNGGCGECQTSCQSACKTSCGIANQPCELKLSLFLASVMPGPPLRKGRSGISMSFVPSQGPAPGSEVLL